MEPATPETYRVEVLGCKVNQYDARQIGRLLERYGLRAADAAAEPDLAVVHTCGVTATAARKSRQAIRRIRRLRPEARIIVTGCAAGRDLTPTGRDPEIRVPAGPDWLRRLAVELDALLPGKHLSGDIDTDAFAAQDFGNQTRALLKVQDGCDIGCSFCIVPRLRKAPRDKPPAVALAEAAALVQAGYREIVVTGVSVGLYGKNGGCPLAALLQRLAEVPGMGRIRLSSLHPGELAGELLGVWAASPKIMPHLHLPLQSGCNAVLRAMRRGYAAEEYLEAVRRARAALGNPAITTDLIVGFPGETDACFAESLAFCRQAGFSQMHLFPYSPRPGTEAARMGGRVGGAIVRERIGRLRALAEEMALAYHRGFTGRRAEVLIEHIGDGGASGYCGQYVPVRFPAAGLRRGDLAQVEVAGASATGLSGAISGTNWF